MLKERKIYYDATFQILAPYRGMATYLNSLVGALSSNGENIKGVASEGLKLKGSGNITYYGSGNILQWEQVSIPKFIKKEDVDLFIFPYNTGPVFSEIRCKSVLILHDVIFMEPVARIPLSNNIKQIIGRFYRKATVPGIVKKADFIITVSKYSKEKIIEHFGVKEEKISVIPNSIDLADSAKAFVKNVPQSYFLNVGGDAPHKNTSFLIKGYSRLPKAIKERYILKIVGVSNPENKKRMVELIKSLGEEHRITLEEFVDKGQLEKLYQGAFIFLFPSLTEGFGIPLLEAMKFGCSIVCSNTSSMPEVCEEAAFYFNPDNIQSFTDTVCLACNNTEQRILKQQEAIKRVHYYSRENFNKKVVDLFMKI